MGYSSSTYIGIFLEVPISTKDVEIEVLKNSSGKVFVSGRFDPETGEPLIVEKVLKKEKVYPNPYFINGLDDTFWMPEHHKGIDKFRYFLLNRRNKFSKSMGECDTFELESIDIPDLIKEFKDIYSYHLDCYRGLGYDVSIKWGILNYDS